MSHESLEAIIARLDAIKKKKGCFLNKHAGWAFSGCLVLATLAASALLFFVPRVHPVETASVWIVVFLALWLLTALALHVERWWHGVGPFFSTKHPLT